MRRYYTSKASFQFHKINQVTAALSMQATGKNINKFII